MTDKERRAIEDNANNEKHIDYYTASILDELLTISSMNTGYYASFNEALKAADPVELNSFIKSITLLHGAISELYHQSGGKHLTAQNELEIKNHLSVIFDLVKEERTG